MKHPYCNEIRIPDDDYFYKLFNVKCIDFVRGFPSPRAGCRLGNHAFFNWFNITTRNMVKFPSHFDFLVEVNMFYRKLSTAFTSNFQSVSGSTVLCHQLMTKFCRKQIHKKIKFLKKLKIWTDFCHVIVLKISRYIQWKFILKKRKSYLNSKINGRITRG